MSVRKRKWKTRKGELKEAWLVEYGGEGAGQEEIIDRHNNLPVARAIYRGVSQYPGRLVMLCDCARVLARSDRPETMP
jgi:hypothetical protein